MPNVNHQRFLKNMFAIAVIIVAVIWLIAVLCVFWRAVVDFCRWCRAGRKRRMTAPPPIQREERPRMLNPRPSLESIERELAINNYIDPPRHHRRPSHRAHL